MTYMHLQKLDKRPEPYGEMEFVNINLTEYL
jgi:hypothetical protein